MEFSKRSPGLKGLVMEVTIKSVIELCEQCVDSALEDYVGDCSELDKLSLVFSTAAAFFSLVQGSGYVSLCDFYPCGVDYDTDILIDGILDYLTDIVDRFQLTEAEVHLK